MLRQDIKAMLPELPFSFSPEWSVDEVITFADFEAWLDKLTEGAEILYGYKDRPWYPDRFSDSTHTALLICPREIKEQTPLEIAVEALKICRVFLTEREFSGAADTIDSALEKIEAAK